MAMEMSTTLKDGLLDRLFTNVSGNLAFGNTYGLKIYSGSKPGANNAATGTTLATVSMASKWAAASNGVARFTSPSTQAASSTNTAGYARLTCEAGTTLNVECDVGTSSNEVRLSTLSLVASTNFNVLNLDLGWGDTLSTVKLSTDLRNLLVDWLTGITASNNSGSPSFSTFEVYKGTMPSPDATPDSGDLLAQSFSFSTSQYQAASAGSKVLDASQTISASATGTAAWARLGDGADLWIYGTVGTSGADFLLSTTSLVTSTNFDVTNATLSL